MRPGSSGCLKRESASKRPLSSRASCSTAKPASSGAYKDLFRLDGGVPKLNERVVVRDSSRIDTLLACPYRRRSDQMTYRIAVAHRPRCPLSAAQTSAMASSRSMRTFQKSRGSVVKLPRYSEAAKPPNSGKQTTEIRKGTKHGSAQGKNQRCLGSRCVG